MKFIFESMAAFLLTLAVGGCTGPSRRPDAGQYADQARMRDALHRYEQPSGRLDPLILLNTDLYVGRRNSRAPVFDVPPAPIKLPMSQDWVHARPRVTPWTPTNSAKVGSANSGWHR